MTMNTIILDECTQEQVLAVILRDEMGQGPRAIHARLLRRGIDWVEMRPGPRPPTLRQAPRGTWSDS